MTKIHPTAIIHSSAKIDSTVEVGPYAVIGEDVVIRPGARIGPHAIIEHADIGENCHIHAHAFVGTPPQDIKYQGEHTSVIIGPRTIIRECVTINRGTITRNKTVIGSDCLLMAYSHVAHDCVIGKGVIMANVATLAGHVDVGNFAILGGLVAIHQFTRIGTLAILGGGAKVPTDIPPYCQAQGDRARLVGLNLVGLKRHEISKDSISALKEAYRTLFLSQLSMAEAISQLTCIDPPEEVRTLIEFLQTSTRGICRPAPKIITGTEQVVEGED